MFGSIFNQSIPGQLYHLKLEGGIVELAEPAQELASMVFYYWLIEVGNDGACLNVIPDGAIDLVLSPWSPEFSVVYLPTIETFEIPLDDPACFAGISFEPEAAQQFFGVTLEQLSTLEFGLQTIQALALSELATEIQNVTDIQHLKAIFDRTLTSAKWQSSRRLGQPAYRFFVEALDSDNVQKIAARIGISERQFRRSIHGISGLPPKKIHRIVRLQQLLHEVFSSESMLLEDGFFDESHRTHEIKRLIGMTSGELRKMAEIYNDSN